MAHFPTAFTESIQPLTPSIGERGNEALARLQEKGYIVATGLTPYFAGAISIMGQQPHIREYCPKDPTPKRFGTQESTANWLQKNGGRGMFLLLNQVVAGDKVVGHLLHGYGWTGLEPCEELPDHPITSAYRLGAAATGKHLAGDFIQSVVFGTQALYAPEGGIGLETWQSNHAAGLYQRLGFVIQSCREGELRPTLDPTAVNGLVEDTRIYMAYPNELFG
jgi:hypothetical protein